MRRSVALPPLPRTAVGSRAFDGINRSSLLISACGLNQSYAPIPNHVSHPSPLPRRGNCGDRAAIRGRSFPSPRGRGPGQVYSNAFANCFGGVSSPLSKGTAMSENEWRNVLRSELKQLRRLVTREGERLLIPVTLKFVDLCRFGRIETWTLPEFVVAASPRGQRQRHLGR